ECTQVLGNRPGQHIESVGSAQIHVSLGAAQALVDKTLHRQHSWTSRPARITQADLPRPCYGVGAPKLVGAAGATIFRPGCRVSSASNSLTAFSTLGSRPAASSSGRSMTSMSGLTPSFSTAQLPSVSRKR